MKPTREPASSRSKPCASLKKPHESCPFAVPCYSCRKKEDPRQTSAFPSEPPRFAPLILAHRGSALPWLVDDRASLRLRRIWGVASDTFSTCPLHTNSGCWKRDEAYINWPMVTCEGSSNRCWNCLEDYWSCAGGLSAVNAIGTQLRDQINSGLTQWRSMAV